MTGGRCVNCSFFDDDPASIERTFPGLNVLSSAYSSVRAGAGLCVKRELFISAGYRCAFFDARKSASAGLV